MATKLDKIKLKRTTLRKLTTTLVNQVEQKLTSESDIINETELHEDYELILE